MDNTKAVQLTEDEVVGVIRYLASKLFDMQVESSVIERMRYLDKRLKDFREPAKVEGWGKPNG